MATRYRPDSETLPTGISCESAGEWPDGPGGNAGTGQTVQFRHWIPVEFRRDSMRSQSEFERLSALR